MTKKPYVGAVVHYRYRANDPPSAAIITRVHDDTWVSLFIIAAGGPTRDASHVELGVGWKWIDEPPAESTTQPQTPQTYMGYPLGVFP